MGSKFCRLFPGKQPKKLGKERVYFPALIIDRESDRRALVKGMLEGGVKRALISSKHEGEPLRLMSINFPTWFVDEPCPSAKGKWKLELHMDVKKKLGLRGTGTKIIVQIKRRVSAPPTTTGSIEVMRLFLTWQVILSFDDGCNEL